VKNFTVRFNLIFRCRNIDFGDILTPEIKAKHKHTTYNLVANIVHDGEPGHGTYRVHVLHKVGVAFYSSKVDVGKTIETYNVARFRNFENFNRD